MYRQNPLKFFHVTKERTLQNASLSIEDHYLTDANVDLINSERERGGGERGACSTQHDISTEQLSVRNGVGSLDITKSRVHHLQGDGDQLVAIRISCAGAATGTLYLSLCAKEGDDDVVGGGSNGAGEGTRGGLGHVEHVGPLKEDAEDDGEGVGGEVEAGTIDLWK